MDQSLDDQAKIVIRLLRAHAGKAEPPGQDVFTKALEWVRIAPGKIDNAVRTELIETICVTFAVGEGEIIKALEGGVVSLAARVNGTGPRKVDEEEELEMKIPTSSWLHTYISHTRYNESPMAYHLACGLLTLGCAVGRKCWMEFGHKKLFPPLSVLLIGPTGVVNKTYACDIAGELIRQACLCPVMADKITMEALACRLAENGTQLIIAPEFSVFFGRQRYNEGLSTFILRMLDFPSEWSVETIGRGVQHITEPTVSVLGGSTMSLLSGASSDEVLSGGFLNRFLTVVEESTPRVFPRPRKGPGEETLLKQLKWLASMTGEIKLREGGPADLIYDDWYRKRNKRLAADPALAEVIQRGRVHILRIAMLVHLIDCNDLIICESCMKLAIQLLNHFERTAANLVRAIHNTTTTSFTDYVHDALRNLGGAADHSTLLRKCSSKMNAAQFKQAIQTLSESGRLQQNKKGIAQYYILKEDVNANT